MSMRLCIADPPYLGRAHRWYGASGNAKSWTKRSGHAYERANGDVHSEAAAWDNPDAHRALVERLISDYDGWAIAMARDNLAEYLAWVPPETHVCVWHKPYSVPGGSRLITCWEPVLVFVPKGRRKSALGKCQRDVLTANAARGFVGAKPRAWTRWVLDMLGYDPEVDTVDDLFHGSGAVAREIAQGVIV
jgi:hypothetical protein